MFSFAKEIILQMIARAVIHKDSLTAICTTLLSPSFTDLKNHFWDIALKGIGNRLSPFKNQDMGWSVVRREGDENQVYGVVIGVLK